jgi:hypothetical protein
MTRRVASSDDKELVGAGQIDELLRDRRLPFHRSLCVNVGDTSYSKPEYLHANRHHQNLVTIARVRSTRTFYRLAVQAAADNDPGHPTWFGDEFRLPDQTTWHSAEGKSVSEEIVMQP